MKKQILRIVAVLLLLATMTMFVPASAASAKPELRKFMLWENNEFTIGAELDNWPEGARIISVKSSKPSVVKASFSNASSTYINLKAGKTGKATVTVKYSLNGKKKSISTVYTVKKYPNAITTLKINGKSVNLKKNKWQYNLKSYNKSNMTVIFKPSSGWKVINSYFSGAAGTVQIKSGKSFAVERTDYALINLLFINKKGEKFFYHINFK